MTHQSISTEKMTLQHALRVLQKADRRNDLKSLKVFIACSFSPLHLNTFIHACLIERYPDRNTEIRTGLYGDLRESINLAKAEQLDVCFVPIEWGDLDGRLDLRRLGSWDPSRLQDILKDAARTLSDLETLVGELATRTRVVVSLPTLPLPPISYFPPTQLSDFDAGLRRLEYEFAERAIHRGVLIVDDRRLDRSASPAQRRDIGSDLAYGFPYSREHAANLAAVMVDSIATPPLMKGIVTDLDDTFWSGIVGEIGAEGVSWDLTGNAQIHGLYQQLLDSLAGAGILIAVASKNDPAVVETAFRRADLVMKSERIFPRIVGWHPKSESVGQILKHWNIGPESVLCVDDSAMELAEVKRVFPQISVIRFPSNDAQGAYDVLQTIRDLFGRTSLGTEDALRVDTLRNRVEFEREADTRTGTMDEFLRDLDGTIIIDRTKDPSSRRAFELINKTNQFNMNGVRLEFADWSRHLAAPNAFQWVVDYRDKYGPLGAISVVLGSVEQEHVKIDTWVMSCRAFSRRIEHKVLKLLFEEHSAASLNLDVRQTERNGPFRDFLSSYTSAIQPGQTVITSAELANNALPVFLKVSMAQGTETSDRAVSDR